MRQLVTIRLVRELIPIDGADRIELAKIDGWQCVVKKGDFKVGDPGLYFEIDSLLPSDDERFAFLEQRKFRIKSMKLKGVLSQGLLMPCDIITREEAVQIGRANKDDLSDIFRVQKYEPPVPIAGQQKGNFPIHLVPKTDQERIQNMPSVLAGRSVGAFEVTEKLDGTSCTFYWVHDPSDKYGMYKYGDCPPPEWDGNHFGACSRNWEMDLDDDNVYATLWKENDLENKLKTLGRNIAIQGEIIGPRIQGNKYKRGKQEFYVFDIYDIDEQSYLSSGERIELTRKLGLNHVPHVLSKFSFDLDLEKVLEYADGTSDLYDTPREGLVFKDKMSDLSFKAISNKWLLKNE